MIGYAVLGLSVLAGYLVAVACSLIVTMGVGSASPGFVVANHRLRGGFKLLHEVAWFLGVMLGGVVTARLGLGMQPRLQESVLCLVLLFALWRNTWEARQRGTAHQILISLLTVAGVMIGFSLMDRLA